MYSRSGERKTGALKRGNWDLEPGFKKLQSGLEGCSRHGDCQNSLYPDCKGLTVHWARILRKLHQLWKLVADMEFSKTVCTPIVKGWLSTGALWSLHRGTMAFAQWCPHGTATRPSRVDKLTRANVGTTVSYLSQPFGFSSCGLV